MCHAIRKDTVTAREGKMIKQSNKKNDQGTSCCSLIFSISTLILIRWAWLVCYDKNIGSKRQIEHHYNPFSHFVLEGYTLVPPPLPELFPKKSSFNRVKTPILSKWSYGLWGYPHPPFWTKVENSF